MLAFPAMALVRRELVTTLRKKRAFALVFCVVGFVIFRVIHEWPSQEEILANEAQMSLDLLNTLGLAALFAGALFLPGLAGSAIATERDKDCFDLLHLTLIGPKGIVLGKLANVIGFFSVVVVGLLPVVGVAFFNVGVSWPELVVRLATLYAFALACGCVGLLASAWCQRTPVAVALAYVSMLCLLGLPVIVAANLVRDLFEVFLPLGWLWQTNWLWPWAIFINASPDAGWPCVLFQVTVACIAFLLTMAVLRRPPKPRVVKEEEIIDDGALLYARRKCFPYYLIDPCRRRPVVEDDRNPMLVKEVRWGFLGRMTRLIRTFYVALFISFAIGIACATNWAAESLAMTLLSYHLAQSALLCLFGPGMLANTFTKERELGNMDMLRMTLMTNERVFHGKVGAALVTLSPILLAWAVIALLLLLASVVIWPQWDALTGSFIGILCYAFCAGYVVCLSLVASLEARTTTGAVFLAYVFLFVALLGTVLGATYLSELMNLRESRNARNWWTALSPLTALWYRITDTGFGRGYPASAYWFAHVAGTAFLIHCLYDYLHFAFGRYYRRDR